MKKKFLILAFFGIMSSCFCQEIYYEVKADTGLFENDGYCLFKRDVQEQRGMIRMMKKGENVKYTFGDDCSLAGFVDDDPSYIVVTDQNGIKGKVVFDDLFLPSNDSMPDKIKNEGWISAYYYEILSGAKSLFECEPYWKNEWHTSAGEELHEDVRASSLRISDNAIRMEGYDKSLVYFLITSVKRLPKCIEVTAIPEIWRLYSKDIFLNKFKQVNICTLIIKEDGDYFDMYLDNPTGTPIMTFAIGDRMKVIDKLESIVLGEKIDLTDIIFPRHADGMCDYDANGNATAVASGILDTSAEKAAILKPALDMGKTALVTESLRLRTSDQTTSQVIATLAAGTRVKVLAHGREDTIDGIASSWVQVSVLDGAKDKDGNAIEAGTVGWLFGGYLSEVESTESERANKEADAKESSSLPIVPIAAGGAVLAVLLAVVILAVKKRISDNR